VRLQLQAFVAELLLVLGSLVYCGLELLVVPMVHFVLVKIGRALIDVCCLLLLALLAVVLQLGFDGHCCVRAQGLLKNFVVYLSVEPVIEIHHELGRLGGALLL
jgi:hypothetical protein